MRNKAGLGLFVILLCCLVGGPTFASEDTTEITAGLRGSIGASRHGVNFHLVEAFGTYQLPWEWELGSDVVLGTYLDASLGALWGGGDTAAVLSVGPGLDLQLLDGKLEFNIGVNFMGLTRHHFGDVDLGSYFEFATYVGVNYEVFSNIILGYRFQHISNAGLSSDNPGLDMHMIEISFRF